MDLSEKRFEQDIESFLISPAFLKRQEKDVKKLSVRYLFRQCSRKSYI